MKLKTLLLSAVLLTTLGEVRAYTSVTPQVGRSYYLYNMGTGKFWHSTNEVYEVVSDIANATPITVESGYKLAYVYGGTTYRIYHSKGTKQPSNTEGVNFTFEGSAEGTWGYQLKSKKDDKYDRYMNANGDFQKESYTNRDWQFIACEEAMMYMSAFCAGIAEANYVPSAKGWEKVTSVSALQSNPKNYLFAIFSTNAPGLMIRTNTSNGQGYYVSASNPLTNSEYLFGLENYSYSGDDYFVMRAQSTNAYYFPISDHAYDLFAPSSGKTTADDACRLTLSFSDGVWNIKTWAVYEGGSNWGLWTYGNGYTNGQNMAGNKTDSQKGSFLIYRIAKEDIATSAIVNPSFETGDKTGWTDETVGTDGHNDQIDILSTDALPGKDGTYFAERWWWNSTINIHQTTESLPSGFYTITAHAKADAGNTIEIYGKAGSNPEVTQSVGDVNDYSLEVYLATPGTIKLGLKGSHVTQTHIAFDNFRLTYLGDLKADLAALKATIDDKYLNNATYSNVGGSERTTLTSSKSTTATSETAAAYETAINSVQDAIDAFVEAKDNYDALAAINEKITAVGTLTYADPEKKPSTYAATSSSDAASHVTSQTTALRAYYESNALAEVYDGAAVNKTSSIANNDAMDGNNSWTWTGSKNDPKNNEPWTDASGSSSHWYFDGGNWWGSSWTTTMSQDITIPAGKYLLTAKARASSNVTFTMEAGGKSVNLPHIGNSGNVFNNGWGDASLVFDTNGSVTILVTASSSTQYEWFSIADFRLMLLPTPDVTISETSATAPEKGYANVTLTRTLKGGQWNGFSVPFSFDVDGSALEGASVKQWKSVSDNEITLEDATEIVAGEPYLVKPTANDNANIVNPTFNGVIVENPSEAVKGTGDYTFQAHLYNTSLATDGSVAYVSTTDSSIKKLTSGGIKGLRAIFNIPTGGSVKTLTVNIGDDTTGILTVDAEGNITEAGAIYNLAGQRMNKAQKGVNIINGRKILIK